MAVCDSKYNLLEYSSTLILIQPSMFFDILEQIPTSSIFHDHKKMFGRLEHLKQSDNIPVSHFFQYLYLLKHLLLLVVIFH